MYGGIFVVVTMTASIGIWGPKHAKYPIICSTTNGNEVYV